MASNWDEEEVARPTINIYDGPQPYNFEPVRREELARADGRQRQLNAWSEENEWRVGEVSWWVASYHLEMQQRALELVYEQQCIGLPTLKNGIVPYLETKAPVPYCAEKGRTLSRMTVTVKK